MYIEQLFIEEVGLIYVKDFEDRFQLVKMSAPSKKYKMLIYKV